MTTGYLLSSLLNIAELTQKNFAERMFASPSKVSKLINGNIFVSQKEAAEFSAHAAHIFATEIFEPNCYIKFKEIFPFILNFTSRSDLFDFLLNALLYAISMDQESEYEAGYGSAPRDLNYSGMKLTQYMFCIICSDYLIRQSPAKLEYYSSIPQYFGYFVSFFDEIISLVSPGDFILTMHQFVHTQPNPVNRDEYKVSVVDKIFEEEEYSDVYYLDIDFKSTNHFFILKDHFVLLFSQYVDGTPQLTLMRSETQLEHYIDFISSTLEKASLRSFRQDKLPPFPVLEDDAFQEVSEKIRIIAELTKPRAASEHPDTAKFIADILEGDAAIYFSTDAVEAYMFSKKIFKPLLNVEELPLEKRVSTFSKVLLQVGGNYRGQIKLFDSRAFAMIVECQGPYSLTCVINVPSGLLKYHIVDTEFISAEMSAKTADSMIDARSFFQNLMRQTASEEAGLGS